MKLAILGATGGTGRAAIAEARRRGHAVVALARTPQPDEPGVAWIVGDATDRAALERLVDGADAVFCALGPAPGQKGDCARATDALVSVLAERGPKRLVVVTGGLIGHPRRRLGLLYRALRDTFESAHPDQAADRLAQELTVRESALEWTVLRPARLADGPRARHLRVGAKVRFGMLAKTRRTDLAAVALDAIERGAHLREGVAVISR